MRFLLAGLSSRDLRIRKPLGSRVSSGYSSGVMTVRSTNCQRAFSSTPSTPGMTGAEIAIARTKRARPAFDIPKPSRGPMSRWTLSVATSARLMLKSMSCWVTPA